MIRTHSVRWVSSMLVCCALSSCGSDSPSASAPSSSPQTTADELAFDEPAIGAIDSSVSVTALAASGTARKTTKRKTTKRTLGTTKSATTVPSGTAVSTVETRTSTPVVSASAGPCTRSGPWRIMPLGDSLTYGNPDQQWSDTYRKDLWKFLQERKYNVDFVGNRKDDDGTFDGDHNGWGGFVTGPDNNSNTNGPNNVYEFVERYVPQEYTANYNTGKDWVTYADPDVVLLNIGTNDAEGEFPKVTRRLGGLVELIQRKAPTARIIVSSIPPSGGNLLVNPLVGKAAKIIAEKSGGRVLYSDVYSRMRAGNPSLGAEPFVESDWRGNGDQTHFSASAGRKFAAAWLPEVELALRSNRCA